VSDPIDIKALDEYLKGGSDISQRYRELGREDVPPELDRRVLDEARAAVANVKGGRSRSWLRWSAPVALAASLVLVVTVVIESGVQNDASFATKVMQEKAAEPQFVPEAPAPVVLQVPPAAAPEEILARSVQADKRTKMEAERSDNAAREEVRAEAKGMRDQALVTSPAAIDTMNVDSPESQLANSQPPPSPAFAGAPSARPASSRAEVDSTVAKVPADSEELSEVSSTSNSRARRAGRTAGPRSTIPSALSTETRPAADEDAVESDPAKWLEQIRDLRRASKVDEADRAWLRFREAYPDFPVASDDLARKK
jgi:hypothetical protein